MKFSPIISYPLAACFYSPTDFTDDTDFSCFARFSSHIFACEDRSV